MPDALPAVTGKQLIRLLIRGGWEKGRKVNHGQALRLRRPGAATLITIVPIKDRPLKGGTLGAILGPKQTQLGRAGLVGLIESHGLK